MTTKFILMLVLITWLLLIILFVGFYTNNDPKSNNVRIYNLSISKLASQRASEFILRIFYIGIGRRNCEMG